MSTRQRSFFEQDHKPKSRLAWNRNRNTNNFQRPYKPPDIPPARQVITGPPIMPSNQTKSKLKAFQFIEGKPEQGETNVHGNEKENIPVQSRLEGTPKTVKFSEDVVQKVSQTPKLVHSKTCPPSTPATRLPLADLVGNTDDLSRYVLKPIPSPEEQLCWHGSQPIVTPVSRRGNKRARSSSPIALSQEEPRLDSIRKEMNTPQADPALELWNRYTSNKGTPTNKGVAFAHLINESSPRSSATAGSVSGLRRWASCGTEFPGSVTKRRKTRGEFRKEEDIEDVFGILGSEGNLLDKPEKSKLAGMLQRMRETIARPEPKVTFANIPSSSSPLPGPGDPRNLVSESPLRHHSRKVAEEYDEQPADSPMKAGSAEAREPRNPSCSSDEFCDEGFDTEMVEVLEISQSKDGREETIIGLGIAEHNPSLNPKQLGVDTATANAVDSDDEFGIDDDDLFTADLEQVASLYDTRSPVEPSAVEQASAPLLLKAATPIIDLVDDDSDDEFGGDDIDVDDLAAAEIAATQALSMSQHPSQQDTRAIQRYLVKRIEEGQYTNERGQSLSEKVLLVEDEKTELFKAITLRQSWYETPCTPGSFVHVIGKFSSTGQCIIDDNHNMLILHPDHLISATVVADSFGCLRRAVLQDRVKATSRANAPMLYGTLLHELFQEALKVNRWDLKFLLDTLDKLLPSKFETILEINQSCEQVKENLRSKLPELQSWAEIFVRAQPRRDAIVKERNGKQSIMSINKLLDVEEHIWSPQYGLKGNIDATVQVVMQDDKGKRVLTVPFEVKTGKNTSNTAHVAQTALYNLLLSNRYDVDVAYGLLYYLETSEVSRIPNIRNDILHMIIKRNELASYVRDRIELPPMLKEDFKCGKCYAQEACFTYDKLVEDGDGELLNKKAKEKYDEFVKYLKPTDQDFMKKWDALLTKEESIMMRFRRELWTMLSTEREKLGRCFSNVILEPGSVCEQMDGSKINRYTYTFVKQKPRPGFSFAESQLIIGEPIVISDEKGHFALANGYVTHVRKRRITVAVDRRLHNARTKLPGYNSQTNQTFAGIMEVSKEDDPIPERDVDAEPTLYRLDKDEFSNGMAAARNNLIQIMDDSVFKARSLRELIVDGRPPAFRPFPSTAAFTETQMSMNDDQKAAVTKVMSAKDYALVLGMPGTGKTTTIAHIIRALVADGKSVLLTSYTHTAVDNILLKICNDKIGILRLGAIAKIHPEVKEFATLAADPKSSLEELEKSWMEPPVVATTCLTINHPLFNRRVFDYCIVDEASQITLPVCLGPIRMANTFVLVGDHYQLPPLVQNKEAAEQGLDISLFKLLCEQHPQSVVSLEHQYRMCAEIMLLSNTFIYSGRLKCGDSAVANRRLQIPNPSALTHHHHRLNSKPTLEHFNSCAGPQAQQCWLSRTLNPLSPVIFLNTDTISPKLETTLGSRITNATEARLVTHLTLSLLTVGISASDIGIIAFYRSQLALLRSSLQSAHTTTQSSELAAATMGSGIAAVELHTADKFQGRDKEVVLVSCVRSNEDGVVGDLLKDRRRINVALTRARSKIVILGSKKTLSTNELLGELVGLCEEKGWIINLGEDDLEGHLFDEGGTQTGKVATDTVGNMSPLYARKQFQKSPPKSPTKRKALGDVLRFVNSRSITAPKPKKPTLKQAGLKTPKHRFDGRLDMLGKHDWDGMAMHPYLPHEEIKDETNGEVVSSYMI